MAELARDYHNDLQYDETEQDPAQKDQDIAEVLQHVDNQEDASGMNDLGQELTEQDVMRSIHTSARGKAAGIDGIPTEFWTKLHEVYCETVDSNKNSEDPPKPCFNIIKFLTAVYNDIERHGVVKGTKFATGWMCPIFKKKTRPILRTIDRSPFSTQTIKFLQKLYLRN
jgi:hypothetical protein